MKLIEFHFRTQLPYLKLVRALIPGLFEAFSIRSSGDTLRDDYRHVKNTSWPILTTAFWRARVKRCHGAVSAWMFHEAASLLHTGRSHTHVCVLVFAGRQSRNAHLNHCHLTDWPVSMALVKKRVKSFKRSSRSSRAWAIVRLCLSRKWWIRRVTREFNFLHEERNCFIRENRL